ncbi:MAG: glycosyltransferase family 4 protein [Magnetococcales bacterium]|nr:glycosyltransferase family 4 protein [Magnetococcales bacterium]
MGTGSQGKERPFILVTGTDPESQAGGIANALPGYLAALDFAGFEWRFIRTHHPTDPGSRFGIWFVALFRITRQLLKLRFRGIKVQHYGHAGEMPALFRQGVILWLVRLLGGRAAIQLHALQVSDYLNHPLKRRLFLTFISGANVVCVLTPWWQQRLTEAGVKKPLAVIPNPLPASLETIAQQPIPSLPPPKPSENPNPGITLLAITRLVPGKGIKEVIKALTYLPDTFRLIVAGDGENRQMLETYCHTLNLDSRVQFTGWVSGKDKEDLFKNSDILCLPSQCDSFGIVFVESMGYGLPVVALDSGPIGDVVPHGRGGLLVKQNDPATLVAAIRSLENPEKRLSLGQSAKRWVLEQFSARVVGARLEKLFMD